jgi:hypothetical protein
LTPLEDEVIVACILDRSDDAHDQAIFIGVVAYLGDGTLYACSSLSPASFTTTTRTLPHNGWAKVGYTQLPERHIALDIA